MKWTIAGHTVPCWICLDRGNRKRAAHHCMLPGLFYCNRHWEFEQRVCPQSDWDLNADEDKEWERYEKEKEEGLKDVEVDPEIERLVTPIIWAIINKEMEKIK